MENFEYLMSFNQEHYGINIVSKSIVEMKKKVFEILKTLSMQSTEFDMFYKHPTYGVMMKILIYSQIPIAGSLIHVKLRNGDGVSRDVVQLPLATNTALDWSPVSFNAEHLPPSSETDLSVPLDPFEIILANSSPKTSDDQCSSVPTGHLPPPSETDLSVPLDPFEIILANSSRKTSDDPCSPMPKDISLMKFTDGNSAASTSSSNESSGHANEWPTITYPLPEVHFSEGLKCALHSGNLAPVHERQLLIHLYNSITKYTFYPSPAQYKSVALSLLQRYSKLSSDLKEQEALRYYTNKLSQKCRNVRQNLDKCIPAVITNREKYKALKLKRNSDCSSPLVSKKKKMIHHGVLHYLPERLISEDDASIAKYIDAMKKEYNKRNKDVRFIDNAMNMTYADRRRFIVVDNPSVSAIKEEYPCLFNFNQLQYEFVRINETNMVDKLKAFLDTNAENLFKIHKDTFAKKSENNMEDKDHNDALEDKPEGEKLEKFQGEALLLLPMLLRDEGTFISDKKEGVISPILRKEINSQEYILEVENVMLCKADSVIEAVSALFISYYILNLEYAKNMRQSLYFLQKIVLDIQDQNKTGLQIPRLKKKLAQMRGGNN